MDPCLLIPRKFGPLPSVRFILVYIYIYNIFKARNTKKKPFDVIGSKYLIIYYIQIYCSGADRIICSQNGHYSL